MATFKAANTQFKIPDGGEMFISLNPAGIAPIVYIRSGNEFFALPLQSLVKTYSKGDGYAYFKDSNGNEIRVDNASQVWEEGKRIFQEITGVNYGSLPQQNIGDVEAAVRGTGGIKPLSSLDQFISVKDTAQPGGDIDISQGQTFDPATGNLIDAQGNVIGNTKGATGGASMTPVTLGSGQTVFVDQQGNFFDQQGNTVTNEQVAASKSGTQTGMTQVTLGNGDVVQVDNQGNFFDLQGNKLTNEQISSSKSGTGAGTNAESTIQPVGQPVSGPGTSTGTPGASSSGVSTTTNTNIDFTDLRNSPEYLALSDDYKKIVEAVFEGVAANDLKLAERFIKALDTAKQLNDPYFGSLLTLAKDAITRGFVSIDNEQAFKEEQLRKNLEDLRTDIANRSEFLTLEESNILRGIERQYEQTLETTQQNLAASGFGSSSRRTQKEQLLSEDRADLVESTTRKFEFEQDEAQLALQRGERDTQAEIERLSELAREGKLDLLRQAEETLGTGNLGNLPKLAGATPLGDIYGDIPRQSLSDTISSAQTFAF